MPINEKQNNWLSEWQFKAAAQQYQWIKNRKLKNKIFKKKDPKKAQPIVLINLVYINTKKPPHPKNKKPY
ncbi:hypothetical protein [Pseudoalteromonas sp. SCSIO 43101]|uniref:hypothetical protein n=1 Tax=Pseudoalteromonas sp. SCSIO 43101 TaxID=2822847 RepID=UPI00202AC88F|nr:hypothetical protein [Pseudoalteromonas sp. SCSIO 43101]URQ92787.1 hypothetical protein J8Z25_18700 [Pseudoalteromonas sp. SCSIO 43101]